MSIAEDVAATVRGLCTAICLHRGEGHLASCLSIVDSLVALYWRFLRVSPESPRCPQRDRFVLSKAHASLAYYCALALRGFFPLHVLRTYGRLGTLIPLEPFPCLTPGVDAATGPLGTGLAKAVGICLAVRRQRLDSRVAVLVGDGEMQKGQTWEALLFAAHARLNHLVMVIDANGRQLDGPVSRVATYDCKAALISLGWDVVEADGHDVDMLATALSRLGETAHPLAVIAHTLKGKGIGALEADESHHYFRAGDHSTALLSELESLVETLPRDLRQSVGI